MNEEMVALRKNDTSDLNHTLMDCVGFKRVLKNKMDSYDNV